MRVVAGAPGRPLDEHASGDAIGRLPWLNAIAAGLGHTPYLLVAEQDGRPVGWLPLALVSSWLFGRQLVSLPYWNTSGVVAGDPEVAGALIDFAVGLADELDVKRLELRHEVRHEHPRLGEELTSKVHMRLPLPEGEDQLWDDLKSKVRSQIRKGRKSEFQVAWGRHELLADFYGVFSQNMRDLGTPVYSRRLFTSILDHFPTGSAELCVVKLSGRPVAAALLVHSTEATQVPSASSLRAFNATNANMWMYWQLLKRAVQRSASTFDFGRTTVDSNTYRFKRQWGATPHPAVWQYYVRRGDVSETRPENERYQLMIRAWRKLPLGLANLLGPPIVRGIP